MKSAGLSIGVAAAVAATLGLAAVAPAAPAAALGGASARGGAAHAVRGSFGKTVVGVPARSGCTSAWEPSAKLPSELVALDRKMAALRLNTARIATETITKEPRGEASGGDGIFEKLPHRHLSKRQAQQIIKRVEDEGVEEGSEAPALGQTVGTYGSVKFESRRIGDDIYTSGILDPDQTRPWLEHTREEDEQAGWTRCRIEADFRSPQGDDLTRLRRLIAGAKTARSIGKRELAGAKAIGFEVKLTPEWAFSSVFETKATKQDRELLRSLRRKLASVNVRLRVWFDPDGLPVASTFIAGRGRAWTTETTRFLETEEPVSVLAPPASETVTLAELRREQQAELKRQKEAAEEEDSEDEGAEISGDFTVEPT